MKNAHKKFRQPTNAYDDAVPSKDWIELQEFEGGKPRLETTIFDIPDELWPLILRDFDRTELAKFMRTCRLFKEVAEKEAPVYTQSNELIRKISALKIEVTNANYGGGLKIRHIKWGWALPRGTRYKLYSYLKVLLKEEDSLIHLFKQCFGNTLGDRPFIKGMEELSDYRRENYPIFSQMSIEEIAKVIKFVDRKFKEIANLLRKEKQTRKISFFHRVRPCAMQELYELMRLIVDKSPITYYEAPAPSSSPPIYENGYM